MKKTSPNILYIEVKIEEYLHCIDGLGWAGLGAVISPLIYSGQMMNVSPVPVTLRRCSLLTRARNEPSGRLKFHGKDPTRLSLMTLASASQFYIYLLWVSTHLA